MSINSIIIWIMMIFMIIGLVDKIVFKDKYGYGEQFQEGVMAMGTLAMAMVGIMCFAPVLGNVLTPVLAPIFKLVGADPAMFAGSILAIDMGGYPLAKAMTDNAQIQNLSGIYLGAMMGATVVFSIPVSLGIVQEKDRPFLAKGMLAGMISIPFGVFIAALVEGIPPIISIVNLIPSIIIAILFALGLAFAPKKMLKGFDIFSKFITTFILIVFAAAIIEGLTGFAIIKGMDPIADQLATVGIIAITLAGAYPLVFFITKVLNKPLKSFGKLLGVNEVAAAGIVASLANNIPTFGMLKDMDERGKVMAVAFSVCASFALGDHLGYASAENPNIIFAMIVGKIGGGLVALFIASLFLRKKSAE
ncbi:MAG: ethanolamine utilization protein EutH [Lachnospirales bacterium]